MKYELLALCLLYSPLILRPHPSHAGEATLCACVRKLTVSEVQREYYLIFFFFRCVYTAELRLL